MPAVERFEATTTVRQQRVVLMAAVMLLFPVAIGLSGMLRLHIGNLAGWLIAPIVAAIQRRPRVRQLAIAASPDGLTVGTKFVPRAKLKSALLRREGERRFVRLQATSVLSGLDVEVATDEDADRLCRALTLDARSTTAEFLLLRKKWAKAPVIAGIAGMVAVGMAAGFTAGSHTALLLPILLGMLGMVALSMVVAFARRAKLRVGAEGMLIRDGLGRGVFHPHDTIHDVRAEGSTIILERSSGKPLRYEVGQAQARKKAENLEESNQIARSIVWRIEKAREAYRALAGAAPQAALVLDRGERSTREWLDELRRVGEGANATFRSALLTRDQLLGIVESASAASRERLAAAVALRSTLSDDEKPRLRVAAERCAVPALRERMVRVIEAPSDEELAATLEEAETDAPRRTAAR